MMRIEYPGDNVARFLLRDRCFFKPNKSIINASEMMPERDLSYICCQHGDI